MGFMDSIRSKYELYRLEQRYTRREKRTTFASGATYVDGEYVYQNGRPALSPGEGAPNDDDIASASSAAASTSSASASSPHPSSPKSASSSGPNSPVSSQMESKGHWGRVPDDVWGAR